MGIFFEDDIREGTVKSIAQKMLIAARTAPKTKGVDNLVMAFAEQDIIKKISNKMYEMAENENAPLPFAKDSKSIMFSDAVVLIGTKIKPVGVVSCGLCGFKDCQEKAKYPDNPCAYNLVDLGIAVGSSVSVAMDSRADNRIMRTIGNAAQKLNLLGEEVKVIFGIPLSSAGKNPFFDRK